MHNMNCQIFSDVLHLVRIFPNCSYPIVSSWSLGNALNGSQLPLCKPTARSGKRGESKH